MTTEILNKAFDPRTSWWVFLGVAGVFLSALFTVLVPESSSAVSGLRLAAFWGVQVFGGLGALQTAQWLVMQVFFVFGRSPLLQLTLGAFLGAAIFAPFALALDFAFGIPEDPGDLDHGVIWACVDEFLAILPPFWLVWMGLNATRVLRLEPLRKREESTETCWLGFWDRVPVMLGRDLVALSAELHYTRVYTTKGDALILYPFGQDVQELGSLGQGVQIHRSHWVTYAHVRAVEPRGQGAVCVTSTELRLPVSRARKADLALKTDLRA